MANEKNPFSEIFNVVKATRHKGLKEKFNPLSEAALPDLKLLLTQAIVKAEKVPSLKEDLTEASRAIDTYNATGKATGAATGAVTKESIAEGPYHWGAAAPAPVTPPKESVKTPEPQDGKNEARQLILTDMQKKLYKALKPYVGK